MKKLLLISIMFLMAWQVSASELYPAIMSYQADRTALNRKYNNPLTLEDFFSCEVSTWFHTPK